MFILYFNLYLKLQLLVFLIYVHTSYYLVSYPERLT